MGWCSPTVYAYARSGCTAMGDHSSPPFAPGSMNTPSAVGCVYMFCCGTNAAERRISLPVAASSTYTKPVFPASTTAFLPPTMARSEEHTSELQSRSDLVCRLLL